MNIKKIARPVNDAKNRFIKWLKDRKADSIEEYQGEKTSDWDYYRYVSGFIGDNLYTVYFMVWNGEIKIDYSDEENRYKNMDVNEFLELIK